MVSREEIAEIEAVSIESCAILQACPNLQFLKLEEIHVTDIARLADFYETHNCQVSVLEFSKLQQTNDKVADFFEAMRRSSSRMSQQIRELRIELHESVVSMDTILAVQEILIANRNLELVILIVVPGFKRLFKSAINLLPPVYLPVASSPCKCDPSWRW
ncbi:hypothetical protein Poli38472_011203 [Pythium oligandrum]|uniref:Uncharacterized protein n=1 Tax=Pythium oligandrum TaxID=41045 RepID=A0A8K1CSN2_PYTOL|nr:hypothetical protein Poli38472_011203 [Pythium oligandrum]|eukprot:TMW67583.1 hypothetical protein Poli38472_011203 [Pythium oligandrum]